MPVFSSVLAEWSKIPQIVYVNQIFPVTIRFITTNKVQDLVLSYEGGENVTLKYDKAPLSKDDLYYYKTLYFKVTAVNAKLPDIIINDYRLAGESLNVQKLSPPLDFCNVLAKDLQIISHKSVQFDKNNNLIVLKIKGKYANLEDFYIPFALKQHKKELQEDFPTATLLYYAFIPANITKFRISYFNTDSRDFHKLFFDIIVRDEIVSTQSDLNPTEDKNKKIKIIGTLFVSVLFLIIAILKRSYLLGFLTLLVAGIAIYIAIPLQKICVKQGAKIYILPTKKSTVFEINHHQRSYMKLNEVNGYSKIKLDEKKVGWVRDEDLCKN
ncbi:hypothetical protein [Nitratiruptor sp. YY09-18]|uniref:hypothetical protein n=1 Tax=Nitratiruptor sp. YY09-18 TaxID=2724901 RepID=UPI0019156EB9|nr:hypothetical protein [Nitratiruptor sp. YY09-18]BCD68195.1 hypothetical protein NitYY0918_C1106 [Nitratiruptor sp. YY09-18]